MSTAVLVLGMHRSGTSAITGVLAHLGVETGSRLLPAHDTYNPKGFWEHAEIVSIHDELLQSLGYAWDDIRPFPHEWWKYPEVFEFRKSLTHLIQRDFGNSALWTVKDPRMCRLLPLWLEILAELEIAPLMILNLREPFSVAKSLEKRDGFVTPKANMLWLQHFLDAEWWSRGYPRIVITYKQLMDDRGAAVQSITQLLGLAIPTSALHEIELFLEPSLRHHHADNYEVLGDELSQLADEVHYLVLANKSVGVDSSLARIRERVNHLASEVTPWAMSMKAMESQIADLSQENLYLRSEVVRIKATFSWRATKPFRLLANLPIYIKKISTSFRNAK